MREAGIRSTLSSWKDPAVLPDGGERAVVEECLDRNIMMEAAAGTGKTTCMVRRMLALLAAGACRIDGMAALTFTRKAASELKSRFQVELEKAVGEARGTAAARLKEALEELDQCFVGTIHSFCARLLRERPVEAGVNPDFSELEDEEDLQLRREAWRLYLADLHLNDPDRLLEEFHRLDIRLPDLEENFVQFCEYPDVEEWPLPPQREEPARLREAVHELRSYVSHINELLPLLPEDHGNDKLIPLCKRLSRMVSHYPDLEEEPARLMEILELFDRRVEVVQKVWAKGAGLDGLRAKAEKNRWEDLRDRLALPLLRRWRESRYRSVMLAFHRAREVYDRLRSEQDLLNYQDLLMKAAELLRADPAVRTHLGRRFTHILVDEFQDTDPVQAEVLFLLTSADPSQADWRLCRPRPGSLFVVGDPKQSIYRFRRADIGVYREVKRLLVEEGGGMLVRLSTNFRSLPALVDWINLSFEPKEENEGGFQGFGAEESEYSPSYVPLRPLQKEKTSGLEGVFRLDIPGSFSTAEEAARHEAETISRFIRGALDGVVEISRPAGDGDLSPSDFLIVTRNTTRLDIYAEALRRRGIPCLVSGGRVLGKSEELRLLYLCLRAALRPEDPLALVAALRSELFGVSDASLYDFKAEGGTFDYRRRPPAGLPPSSREVFEDAFERLRKYRGWLKRLPAPSALSLVIEDLGLQALAACREGGDAASGALLKAVEMIRGRREGAWSTGRWMELLQDLVEGREAVDALSVLPEGKSAVRVMNLHKAKGLEAPVVFLADAAGAREHPPKIHVDRTGEKVRGYMAFYSAGWRGYGGRLFAHPGDWENIAEKEARFVRAEELRLRYVAATRAGSMLVISQREKRNNDNPWRAFAPYLQDLPALPLPDVPPPGGGKPPSGEKDAAGKGRRGRAAVHNRRSGESETSMPQPGLFRRRLEEMTRPGYISLAAKEYAELLPTPESEEAALPPEEEPSPAPGEAPLPPPEEGPRWGSVIHVLLRWAAEGTVDDLEEAARSALAMNDLPAALAGAAADTVRGILRSPIWKRAEAAETRLAEVPFQVVLEEDPRPVLVRGVVDLAFVENGKWVLVDYKTDRAGGRIPRNLLRKYVSQLETYRRAWRKCTGGEVGELYLYFIVPDLLLRVG